MDKSACVCAVCVDGWVNVHVEMCVCVCICASCEEMVVRTCKFMHVCGSGCCAKNIPFSSMLCLIALLQRDKADFRRGIPGHAHGRGFA